MSKQMATRAGLTGAALAMALAGGCAGETALHGQLAQDAGGDQVAQVASQARTTVQREEAQRTAPAVVPTLKANDLILHEWGTFTSVQGSDGSTQDGLQHEEEALPDFVYGREKLANHQKNSEGLPEPCNQKMETPVVYFYTAKPQQVDLKVTFTNGIISQWFPAVASLAPEIGALKYIAGGPPLALAGGSLTWKVQLDPGLDMATAPQVPADSVWQPSRQTQATPLRFAGADTENTSVDQTERFLFYRGLGRFTLPVKVLSYPKGDLRVHNDGAEALPFALLLKSTADGHGGVQVLGPIAAHASANPLFIEANLPVAQAVAASKLALKGGLVATGLYDDEAQAMVDTWQKSWFASPGTRLLYILPPKWTEALLPMQVSPAPTQSVRTLVGRIEALSVQEEVEAQSAVIQAKTLGYASLLTKIDRFLEPRLHRACAQLDPAVYATHCANLLDSAKMAK